MLQDIFSPTRVTAVVGGKEIIFETGRLANQAHGAVWVQCGGTVVLVTVCSQPLEFDKGFFPLTVEYSEKMYAAGRIPGSFFRREIGRPSERETLVSRLIDRPIRPLFPKGLNEDVQVLASVISADQENESDVLALTGASAAVMLSPLPFAGPVAGGRIGRVNGQFVLNPSFEEQKNSDLDIVFAASADALTALLLDGVSGGLAGAIGLALADILAGDPGYAITTFVLKFIIGITCGAVAHKAFKLRDLDKHSAGYLVKVIAAAGSGLLLNVVTDPFLGYFRNVYIFGQEYTVAQALSKIAGGVTFVNSVASTVCAVILYLALRPALERAGLLPKGEKH